MKIINLKFLALNPEEEKNLRAYKKSKTFSELEKHLHREHTKILELKTEVMTIKNYLNKRQLREIYNFWNNSPTNVTQSQKIEATSMKQNFAPIMLYSVTKNIWRNKKLTSFDKNYICCFLMNSYLDKQDKWLKNRVLHPLCFACGEEFEPWDHLLFPFEGLKPLTLKLSIFSWKDIWLERSCLSKKLLVAVMRSSWTETSGDYLKYFLETMNIKKKTK